MRRQVNSKEYKDGEGRGRKINREDNMTAWRKKRIEMKVERKRKRDW